MPKGEHLLGKKSGNNFALDTSIQPTNEQKSNGWVVRNRLIKAAQEIAEFAENTKFETVIVNGQEFQMSILAYAFYMQLRKAIDKSDTQAFLAYIRSTEGFRSKHALVNENEKTSYPCIVFSHSQEDLLKALIDPTIELSESDNDRIKELIKSGAKLV